MKWIIGLGFAALLGLGVFFYWGSTSETVENKQEEIAQEVYSPIENAKEAKEASDNSQSGTEERIEEIAGE